MESNRANLEVFSETVANLAESDLNILVVTSDSRGSAKLASFGESYPNQIIEVGIAEQNLVGVSAGLASTGKKVFAVSPASFLTARSLEQIKNDIAYSDNPVNVIGISGGVSYGALGTTHHSLHDIAVLRAINNIKIILPADNFETSEAIKQSAASDCQYISALVKNRCRISIKQKPSLKLERPLPFVKVKMWRLLRLVKRCILLF